MPYFETYQETCVFLGAMDECSLECPKEDEIMVCYEEFLGDPYHLDCMFIEEGEDVSAEIYQACSGVEFNSICEAGCAD